MQCRVERDDPRIGWSLEQNRRNVHTLRWSWDSIDNAEAWILLSSDRHHDNVHTDQALELAHLKEAQKRGAAIIDVGDMHCAMQGRWDRRKDASQLRPEYQCNEYLDALVELAADFYSPYAQNFAVVGVGNHETGILRHHETDLTERTCERMSALSGHRVFAGGYSGWVRLVVQWHGSKFERLLHYFHGSGGAAPMSHGTLSVRRLASWLPDPAIICTGHSHHHWVVPLARMRLRKNGDIEQDEQLHIRIGSYKGGTDRHSGWEVERGMAPTPIGACWLRLSGHHSTGQRGGRQNRTLKIDAHRAD